MDSFKMIIVIVVGLLGALSFFTGIGAEATKIKASQIEIGNLYCWYPASPANGLGFTAAAALIIGQIIVNFASGCFCCRRTTTDSNTSKLRWFTVLYWVAFVLALRLFLAGINLNDRSVKTSSTWIGTDGYIYTCYYVRPGVFVSGSFLAALSLMLALFCYVAYYNKDDFAVSIGGNIPMANPQFGPNQGMAMGMGMGMNNNNYSSNPQFPSNYNNNPPQSNYNSQQV